jgi:hypothetical protein
MNRRRFLAALGGVAVARRISAFDLATLTATKAGTSAVSLRSGSNRLDLVSGATGYGISISTAVRGKMERVAFTPSPVTVFYGTRMREGVVQVAFQHAALTAGGLEARAKFADLKSNQWEVAFRAARAGNDGFACRFDYRLVHGTAENIFFEHPLTPDMPADGAETYVLMPGLLYDGNRLTELAADRAIPQLAPAQNFEVDTPVLTLAIPMAAFLEKATGKTLMVLTEPATALDMSGFHCSSRQDEHRIAVTAPVYREQHYHHNHYTPETPKGATLAQGASFSVPVSYFATVCPGVAGLFEAVQPLRDLVRPELNRTKRLPLSAAAMMVEDNFNTRMWAEGAENQFYINAMLPNYDIAKSGIGGLTPGWQLQAGWCAGAITGYALLKMGDELSRKRSRAMFDRIAGGLSPSGLFWSIYANGKWDPVLNNIGGWQHMRMPADATFYFLKAIALERSSGLEHPDWEKAAISNLDAFTRLWREHQDFGHKVDRNTLAIVDPGTAAGALCIGGLALGAGLPRGREYLAVAREAGKTFYEQYVRTGWIVGGPLDIPNAPDSESATALLESYVTMFEVTRDRLYLDYARATARILSTWVVAYNANFPEGTFCREDRIQTVGGVLANSQNHHIGPSFCTNSGSALLRLYRYTGDTFALRLLEDTISGLPQYVSTGKEPFNIGPGMVSEQFNMSDELGSRGQMGWVCASWPETCVLLSYGEVPSVFVDLDKGRCAVFDQIAASFDARSRSLRLENPTAYAAKVRVQRSRGNDLNLQLAAGEKKVISLATA